MVMYEMLAENDSKKNVLEKGTSVSLQKISAQVGAWLSNAEAEWWSPKSVAGFILFFVHVMVLKKFSSIFTDRFMFTK